MELAAIIVVGGTATLYSLSALARWLRGGAATSASQESGAPPFPPPGAMRVLPPTPAIPPTASPFMARRNAICDDIVSFQRNTLRPTQIVKRAPRSPENSLLDELRVKLAAIAEASTKSPENSPATSRPGTPSLTCL